MFNIYFFTDSMIMGVQSRFFSIFTSKFDLSTIFHLIKKLKKTHNFEFKKEKKTVVLLTCAIFFIYNFEEATNPKLISFTEKKNFLFQIGSVLRNLYVV